MSRQIWTYSRVRASGFGNGTPYQPSTTCGPLTPSPRCMRPPDRRSSVIALIAVAAGVRADSCTRPVQSLTREVCAPIQDSGVKASLPQDSAVQTESKPQSSACLAGAIMSPGPCPDQ